MARISNVLDNIAHEAPVQVKHEARYRYLVDAIGEQQLRATASPETIKAACDGAYLLSDRMARELAELARLVGETTMPGNKFGRGTVFYKAIQSHRS